MMKNLIFSVIHKGLKSNSFIFSSSSFISKIFSIFLIPLYTRNLDIASYGLFDLILIVLTFLNIIFSLEISQAMSRYIPVMKGERARTILISSGLSVILLLCMILLILMISAAVILRTFITNELSASITLIFSYELMPYISIYFILNIIHIYLKNNLRWLLMARQFFIQVVIYSILSISLTYYWLVINNIGLKGVYIAQICASLTTILYNVKVQFKYVTVSISKRYIQLLLGFSVPLIFSSLSIVIATFMDRIYITSKLGLDQLAVYSLANRLATIPGFIIFGLVSSYLPRIYKNSFDQKIELIFEELFVYILSVAFFISLLLTFFHSDIVLMLSNENYLDAGKVGVILSISVIFANSIILFPGLFIEKKTSFFAKINLILIGCNFILNWIAVEFFNSIMAVSFATLISQILYFVVNMKTSQRYYNRSFRSFKSYWLQLSLLILILILSNSLNDIAQLSLIYKILLVFVFSIVFINSMRPKLAKIKNRMDQ